jgi:hypothetical protein
MRTSNRLPLQVQQTLRAYFVISLDPFVSGDEIHRTRDTDRSQTFLPFDSSTAIGSVDPRLDSLSRA